MLLALSGPALVLLKYRPTTTTGYQCALFFQRPVLMNTRDPYGLHTINNWFYASHSGFFEKSGKGHKY